MPKGHYDRSKRANVPVAEPPHVAASELRVLAAERRLEEIEAGVAAMAAVGTVATPLPSMSCNAVRLAADHGFVTEIDTTYFKPAGAVITNPLEIAVLRDRGAPLEAV